MKGRPFHRAYILIYNYLVPQKSMQEFLGQTGRIKCENTRMHTGRFIALGHPADGPWSRQVGGFRHRTRCNVWCFRHPGIFRPISKSLEELECRFTDLSTNTERMVKEKLKNLWKRRIVRKMPGDVCIDPSGYQGLPFFISAFFLSSDIYLTSSVNPHLRASRCRRCDCASAAGPAPLQIYCAF